MCYTFIHFNIINVVAFVSSNTVNQINVAWRFNDIIDRIWLEGMWKVVLTKRP